MREHGLLLQRKFLKDLRVESLLGYYNRANLAFYIGLATMKDLPLP